MFQEQVQRGFMANIETLPPLVVKFQFNPESVKDNKAVKYADRNKDLCGNAPGKIYTGGGARTLSFDFKLHGLEQGSGALSLPGTGQGIASELAKLRSFLYPKEDAFAVLSFGGGKGKRLASPPTCIFGFGKKMLECVVMQIDITETQFNHNLEPVRADVSVTLEVIEDDDNALYKLDRLRRNTQAALGVTSVDINLF